MKVAYFTAYPVKISETFFSFLIKELEKKSEQLLHIVGTKNGSVLVLNTYFSGFVLNNQFLRLLYELQERLFHKRNYALRIMQRHAFRKLAKIDDLKTADVAFVEYGKTAVRVYKFLISNEIPFVVHFHGNDASAAFNSWVYANEIKKVFKEATFIITASNHVKRLLILRGCEPDKIKVVRYGIDTDKMQPLSWEVRKLSPPSIAFLGRLTEKKNPVALLHSFKLVKEKIPEAKLTFIGEGKLYKVVYDCIADLDLMDSVEMLGAMEHENALNIVNKHWVFAQHNVSAVDGDQEGYVLAIAEAAALELPVVSTFHNGIPEHVINGKTGFLVQEYDYEAMASKIIDLLTNLDQAREFGRQGRLNIRKINNPETRIKTIYKLLQIASYSNSVLDPKLKETENQKI